MKFNPIFEFIPIETKIKDYQDEYYSMINELNKTGDLNIFIEFMLKIIDEALDDLINSLQNEVKNISDKVNNLLDVMEFDIPLSAKEIMKKLNIKSKETLRNNYLNPAFENGLIIMTHKDTPNSKNQKYY